MSGEYKKIDDLFKRLRGDQEQGPTRIAVEHDSAAGFHDKLGATVLGHFHRWDSRDTIVKNYRMIDPAMMGGTWLYVPPFSHKLEQVEPGAPKEIAGDLRESKYHALRATFLEDQISTWPSPVRRFLKARANQIIFTPNSTSMFFEPVSARYVLNYWNGRWRILEQDSGRLVDPERQLMDYDWVIPMEDHIFKCACGDRFIINGGKLHVALAQLAWERADSVTIHRLVELCA